MGSKPIGMSASRISGIIGMSRFKTAVDVWLEILEDLEPGFAAANNYAHEPFFGNPATRAGTAFEDAIIGHASNLAGIPIVDRELLCRLQVSHDVELTCHIDGAYFGQRTLHEGKTTNLFSYWDDWGADGTAEIPVEYQAQVQAQLAITQYDRAVVSLLVFPARVDALEEAGLRFNSDGWEYGKGWELCHIEAWMVALAQMGMFHQFVVEADPALQKDLKAVALDFWREHVVKKVPPTPTCYEDVRKLFRDPKGTVVADANLERMASEYSQINAELGAMAKRKDQIKTAIVAEMAKREGAPVDKDSKDKWVLRGASGKKLASYNGNKFTGK